MTNSEKRLWIRRQFLQLERPLLRYVMRFVDLEQAKDIVQEGFIQLMKVDPPEKVEGVERPWLFRVCRNRALDRLKKEGKMKTIKNQEELPFEGESADATMGKSQEAQAIGKLILALKPHQKEVVRLKFQEGLSYKEISDITGYTVSHVGVLLHESIKILRKNAKNQSLDITGGGL